MAKNFASVLDSLRAAGDVKIQEVDSVYALNCDWLLEQFKYTQASLLALASKSGGPGDKQEQQSTAKTGNSRGPAKGKHVLPAGTSADCCQGDESQHTGSITKPTHTAETHAQAPVASTPLPRTRMTRSRRGQNEAAATTSAQGNQQFPSPPKTRARGKRNQTASKPAAVLAGTRSGAKAMLAHSEAADESNSAKELHDAQQPVHTDVANPLSQQSPLNHVKRLQKASSSPVAVLATVSSAHSSPNEQLQQHQEAAAASPAEASMHGSPAHVASPPETSTGLVLEQLQHAASSMSRAGKRKQSVAGESEAGTHSKRHQSSMAKLEETDPDTSKVLSELQPRSKQQVEATPSHRGRDGSGQLEQHPADEIKDVSTQQAEQHDDMLTDSAPETVADSPDKAEPLSMMPDIATAAGIVDDEADTPSSKNEEARISDYQDAQERLSSPVHTGPETHASHQEQQHAELASPVPSQDRCMSPASLAGSVHEQDAETSEPNSPAAASSIHASPDHDDPADAKTAADVAVLDNVAAAGDGNAQSRHAQNVSAPSEQSALGAAAALPLPVEPAIQGQDEAERATASSDAPSASGGMAGNLVSAIRSFLPGGKAPEPQLAGGKKPVKVKALEAADAARRREAARNADRIKQKSTLDKQRAERAKAKQEEEQQKAQEDAKKRQEAIRKREEEAVQRRRAKEEAERKERQERQVKAEATRAKKKAEELKKKEPERPVPRQAEPQPNRAPLQAHSNNLPAPVGAPAAHVFSSKPMPHPSGPTSNKLPLTQVLAHTQASASGQVTAPPIALASAAAQQGTVLQTQNQAAAAVPATQARQIVQPADPEAETYQISPYRGDDGDAESSDGDDPGKPIPEWARGRALMQQLASQVQTDPDEVFQQHRKTCSLDEVFGHSDTDRNNKQKKDLSRRSSSGNWIEDRVTWKEELKYKKAMGYV